jgi:methyl-accepting chemotaxis protein
VFAHGAVYPASDHAAQDTPSHSGFGHKFTSWVRGGKDMMKDKLHITSSKDRSESEAKAESEARAEQDEKDRIQREYREGMYQLQELVKDLASDIKRVKNGNEEVASHQKTVERKMEAESEKLETVRAALANHNTSIKEMLTVEVDVLKKKMDKTQAELKENMGEVTNLNAELDKVSDDYTEQSKEFGRHGALCSWQDFATQGCYVRSTRLMLA